MSLFIFVVLVSLTCKPHGGRWLPLDLRYPHTCIHARPPPPPNDTISDTSPWHPDPRTSSAHTAGCRPPARCGRTARGPASVDFWRTRPRISGSRRRWIWRSLAGWRRSARCDPLRKRARGCRRWRICPGRRLRGVRRSGNYGIRVRCIAL